MDSTIGRTFLMTRPENNAQQTSSASTGTSLVDSPNIVSNSSSGGVVGAEKPSIVTSSDVVNSSATNVVGPGGATTCTTNGPSQGSSALHAARSASDMDASRTKADDSNYLNTSGGSTSILMNQMSKDLIFTSENRARLGLLKTCVALIPRMMPMFKGRI